MTLPVVTPSQLRSDFPEFGDRGVYTDSQINFWLTVAYKFVNALRWGSSLNIGVELFTCHNLVLEKQAADAASFGGAPGVAGGPVSAKSVDKVSVNYDTGAGADPDSSHWNTTVYGTRYKYMIRLFGAGPINVSGSNCEGFGLSGAVVWGGQQFGSN